ncbi:MAG: hypothetical protein WCJ58_04745 [bacterium]
MTSPLIKNHTSRNYLLRYTIAIIIFTFGIAFFSLIMSGIASYRNDITSINYSNAERIYNGPLEQNNPYLDATVGNGNIYVAKSITKDMVKYYVDNTALTSTDANVVLTADFVKKGLTLQPAFKTQFRAKYLLKNDLDQKSIVSFIFPLPVNSATNEISNAKLVIDGIVVPNAKTTIKASGDYYSDQGALKWEGEIAPKATITIESSYDTVGLSVFTYKGIENSKGSQDFNFSLQINGTRAYNVTDGLSVDKREFGDKYVKLTWTKPDLYSQPLINVSVGEKLNPSTQVSRIYMTMAPVYLIFSIILVYLAYKFAKPLAVFDLFIITILFIVYFPLIHYLSSFTVDPTIAVFENIKNVGYFSMPLYGAFALAALLVGGMMYYFIGRISGFKFATKFAIPTLVLFIGFFPLVVTIPEYSMLLVIIGVIALIAIILQVRVKMLNGNHELPMQS